MSILTIKLNMELDNWKEKLNDVTGKLENYKAKEIFQSINDYEDSSINEAEYFNVLATKMTDLIGIKLQLKELEGNLLIK